MAIAERAVGLGERVYAHEAAGAVRLQLGEHFDRLVEEGGQPRAKNGKLEIYPYAPMDTDAEIGSPEYDELRERQYEGVSVEGFSLRRSLETGAISYAEIHGETPAQISDEESMGGLFRADTWNTRMFFPPKHDAQEGQRLVVESWQMPYVHMGLAANVMNFGDSDERRAAYSELYANLCNRKDAAGIPLGAIAIERLVIGRDTRSLYLPEEYHAKLNDTMGHFAQGVSQAIAANRRIDAEIAAEQA